MLKQKLLKWVCSSLSGYRAIQRKVLPLHEEVFDIKSEIKVRFMKRFRKLNMNLPIAARGNSYDEVKKNNGQCFKNNQCFPFCLYDGYRTYQVLSRYLFGKPSTISEGLLSYSFAWMALLAAAYVFGKREHMRMSFITDKFSDSNQLKISLIGELITFAFAVGALIYGGIAIVQWEWGNSRLLLAYKWVGFIWLFL